MRTLAILIGASPEEVMAAGEAAGYKVIEKTMQSFAEIETLSGFTSTKFGRIEGRGDNWIAFGRLDHSGAD